MLIARHFSDAATLCCAAMQPSSGPGLPSESVERLRRAWQLRPRTDYVFDFWTAFGWTVLTLGLYAFYVLYQLVRRSRDHNARRLELLDAAASFAWEEVQLAGATEEMRPYFERMGANLETLRRSTRDFRDPVVWLLLSMVSFGVTGIVAAVLLNRDLIAHDVAEVAIETDLAQAFARLGRPLPVASDTTRVVGAHNYLARVVAAIASLGIYGFWWAHDLMRDGNEHFATNWKFEDDVVQAVQELIGD